METTAQTQTAAQSVCFAYFGDGQFLGWYADTFGSIRPQSPKVYSSLESMRERIEHNFKYKVQCLRDKTSNPAADFIGTQNPVGGALIAKGLSYDETILEKYTDLELRAVACPYYDGPKLDFDQAAYETAVDMYKTKVQASGILDLPVGVERTVRLKAFNDHTPQPKCDNWTYVDYVLVKEWAANEPTEFLEIYKA